MMRASIVPRTGNREPPVVGSKAPRIVEERDERHLRPAFEPESRRRWSIERRPSCRRDLPALDFHPELSGARLRPGIWNHHYERCRPPGAQARCDRQDLRQVGRDIDHLDAKPRGKRSAELCNRPIRIPESR